MRAVLLLGGHAPDAALLKTALDGGAPLICADSGLDAAHALGVPPFAAIGDFDSVSPAAMAYARASGARITALPDEKDDTDGVAALDAAINMGASRILILGASGGRIDHLIANIALLARAAEKGVRAAILDGVSMVTYRAEKAVFQGQPGNLLSVLALSAAYISSTEGLYYPMFDKWLGFSYPLGISNVFTAKEAVVCVERGACLFVQTPAPERVWSALNAGQ